MASLIQLNKKFSTVHCFESHIQLRRRHMGSKRATASRDLKHPRPSLPLGPARRAALLGWGPPTELGIRGPSPFLAT